MRTDLPQIINYFEDEVIDQIEEMLNDESVRLLPKIPDQFHGLHEAGILAVERLKQHLVFPEVKPG